MRARYIFVVLFVCLSVSYSCDSRPTLIQECSPKLDASLAEGTLLLSTENLHGGILWQILDLATGRLRSYDLLNNPVTNLDNGGILFPPDRVSDIRISPDGKRFAYRTYLQEKVYIISSQDGVSTIFASTNQVVLTYAPGSQTWFITEANPRVLDPLKYPLMSMGNEEKLPHVVVESIDPAKIAVNWSARLGTREIPTLAIISSDGQGLHYFPDRLNEWQGLEGWINANDLQLTSYTGADLLDRFPSRTLNTAQTILLDWQTGEKLVSGDDLPDKYFRTWAPVYSPSKRYVSYLGQQENLIIFDRIKHKITSQIPIQTAIPYAPVWIDETRLVVVSRDEKTRTDDLLLLSRDSNLQQSIRLSGTIASIVSPPLLPQPSNRKLISFWVTDPKGHQSKLLFVNVEWGYIYDFCLDFDEKFNMGQGWLLPPNRFGLSMQHDDKTEIIIVDILRRRMFRVLIPSKAVVSGAITLP